MEIKALNYLQFCRDPGGYKNINFYEKLFKTRYFDNGGYEKRPIENFYAQPFKPELIEKYFSGLSGVVTMKLISETFPETLDDFIRDCQRAGIELMLKEI